MTNTIGYTVDDASYGKSDFGAIVDYVSTQEKTAILDGGRSHDGRA